MFLHVELTEGVQLSFRSVPDFPSFPPRATRSTGIVARSQHALFLAINGHCECRHC
jgi:hypothetical protein